MKNKPILITTGDLNSIFFEIFLKALKIKIKSPILLICNKNILKNEIRKIKLKKKIKFIDPVELININFNNNYLYILNVDLRKKSNKFSETVIEKNYVKDSFELAFGIIKKGLTNKFLNGPINKSKFLNKKKLGITEYIADKFKCKNVAMLIYNKKLSVCPVTTHMPLKVVSNKIKKNLIINRIKLINNFYISILKNKPKIAVTGLNPHCETIYKENEDKMQVEPAIKNLQKKGIKVDGPFASDTLFMKYNRNKYDIIIGMYHDQVLGPLKTLFEYDAINITIGLPFLRVSPDHGPNISMVGKNKSNPQSLINALKFLDSI